MTVTELIVILQRHGPSAMVVVPTDSETLRDPIVQALRPGDVQAVEMRRLESKKSWFDPNQGAVSYEIDEGDEHSATVEKVPGVVLGAI